MSHESDSFRILRFFDADDPNILFDGKATADLDYLILVVVNLDPFATHDSWVHLTDDLGIRGSDSYVVHDLLSDARYTWLGRHNWSVWIPRSGGRPTSCGWHARRAAIGRHRGRGNRGRAR
jgi:hypothetical protein